MDVLGDGGLGAEVGVGIASVASLVPRFTCPKLHKPSAMQSRTLQGAGEGPPGASGAIELPVVCHLSEGVDSV